MWKYKLAQEFIGSDGLGGNFIQDTKIRNFDSEYLPQDIKQPENPTSTVVRPEICPICKSKLENFEFQGRFLDSGEEIYRCNNCHNTNDPYKRKVYKNKKSRVRKKRARNEGFVKESASISNPNLSGINPANQPWGRLDLSDDERVIPWNRIEDGFREEFDHQKQKKNFKYKIIKKKKPSGGVEFVRVKVDGDSGEAIQPSNVYTERGRVKKQPRYNPEKNRNKNKADGSWPHNRNPGTEGWYGQENTGSGLDSDMRYRVMSWADYIADRSSFMTNLTRP